MQLGGSLIDTITVPVPGVGIEALPPLQPIPANSKAIKAHHKSASFLDIERNIWDFIKFSLNWKLKTKANWRNDHQSTSLDTLIRNKF
jgi:transposase